MALAVGRLYNLGLLNPTNFAVGSMLAYYNTKRGCRADDFITFRRVKNPRIISRCQKKNSSSALKQLRSFPLRKEPPIPVVSSAKAIASSSFTVKALGQCLLSSRSVRLFKIIYMFWISLIGYTFGGFVSLSAPRLKRIWLRGKW